jgi:hypothetical protein
VANYDFHVRDFSSGNVFSMQRRRKASGLGPQTGRVVANDVVQVFKPTHNFFGIGMSVDLRDIKRLSKWIDRLPSIIEGPEVFSPGIAVLGSEFAFQFESQGTRLGNRWQPLSKMTQATRAKRGFDPKSPILVQSGELRRMAVGSFQDFSSGGARTMKRNDRAARGYTPDGTTYFTMSVSSLEFNASITGPKVDHMTGSTMVEGSKKYGAGYLPRRPFWALNPTVMGYVEDAILTRVMMDWQSAGGRWVSRSHFNNSYVGGVRVLRGTRQSGKGRF